MIEKYLNWLESHQIKIDKEKIEKLNSFSKLVFEWNRKINLTAARNEKEIVTRHILDSLMPLKIGADREKELLDLGSGGGFPAIPLAIMLDKTKFLLVEKVAKKCAFLNKAKRELELKNIFVENTMFEQLQSPLPKVLITRAVRIDKKLLNEMKKKENCALLCFFKRKTGKYSALRIYPS